MSQDSSLQPFVHRCEVTYATDTVAPGIGQAPVWCEDDASACVSGLKQMLYWGVMEVTGKSVATISQSPAYGPRECFFCGVRVRPVLRCGLLAQRN
ncbi:hypothetical protein FISHEDRAFT_49868 [Fistulina hepatica ATCC 64428]|uniref:Uncharacterized protein n=1 Tax=Fistulina hepatica ATCC 64428 TaxID=1128425 RepID=A0A0D7A426_9AGAR|nr:hypothetical protein FISHEDRAFT_49868 [Fistulina hepatica ATCC 64428]